MRKSRILALVRIKAQEYTGISGIADDYRSGMTLDQIAEKRGLINGSGKCVVRNALSLALKDLIPAKELELLETEHKEAPLANGGRERGGLATYLGGTGMFSSETKAAAVEARGLKPWREDLVYAYRLTDNPKYQHQRGPHVGKADIKRITDAVNRKYRDGEKRTVRATADAIRNLEKRTPKLYVALVSGLVEATEEKDIDAVCSLEARLEEENFLKTATVSSFPGGEELVNVHYALDDTNPDYGTLKKILSQLPTPGLNPSARLYILLENMLHAVKTRSKKRVFSLNNQFQSALSPFLSEVGNLDNEHEMYDNCRQSCVLALTGMKGKQGKKEYITDAKKTFAQIPQPKLL